MRSKSDKKDVVLYFAAKILSGILSFVLISVLTHIFTPDLYGDYSLIYGMISVIISITIGWISSSCLRYYAKYKDDKETFYTNIFVQWLAMFALAAVVLVLISSFSADLPMKNCLFFAILCFAFNSIFELFSVVARAARETFLFLIVSVCQYIACIATVLILHFVTDLGVEVILLAYILSFFVASTILIVRFKFFHYINLKKISKDFQLLFLRYGLPMIGVWATSWVLNYSDRYIIKMYFDSSDVGIYDVSYKLSENSLSIVVTAFTMAIMPILVEKFISAGFGLVKIIHRKFMNCYFLLMLPAVVGLISVRKLLFGTIISAEYADGDIVIALIAISTFFYGCNQMLYKLWQVRENTSAVLLFNVVSVFANIVLNFLLVPRFGAVMAAVTTLLSNMIITLILFIRARIVHKYKVDLGFVLCTVICSAVLYGASFMTQLLPIPRILLLILSVVVGVIAYAVASLVLHKELRKAVLCGREDGGFSVKNVIKGVKKVLEL